VASIAMLALSLGRLCWANTPDGYAEGRSSGGSNGTANELTGQALLDAVFAAGLEGRPYYGGYEGSSPALTIAWDTAHGLL
jgi:hypothetical protein